MYSPQVLDHFEHPRNAGVLENPDASMQIENPACGDVLKLTLRLSFGQIAEIRFQAKGCVAAMACASALTELALGKSPAQARALRIETLLAAVGGLPPASQHGAQLALDTLDAALNQLASRARTGA
jgi:nitrogen fixation protein NifU and related proteins